MTQEPQNRLTVKIRSWQPEKDYSAVRKSYLETLWDFFYCAHVSRRVFNEFQPRVLDRIVEQGVVWVACNKDDEDQIFGFLIGEPAAVQPILHLLYVKKPFRFLGIEEMLLDQLAPDKAKIEVACSTKWTKMFLEEKYGARANPYVLYSSAYL